MPEEGVDDSSSLSPDEKPSRRWVRGLFALLALWLFVCLVVTLLAARHLRAGKTTLTELTAVDPLNSEFEVLDADLASAEESMTRGASLLQNPLLWPLRPLPVIGRQLASARDLATTSEEVIVGTRSVLSSAVVFRDASEAERIDALGALRQDLTGLSAALADRELGPGDHLVGPLAAARNQAEAELAIVEADVNTALAVVAGLESFLASSDYLLLAANVNEMQAGAGTPLSLGEVELDDGRFGVSAIQTVEFLEISPDLPVLDADVETLWGFLSPSNDFKKVMLSPRFDQFGGPQSLLLYDDVTGRELDGVLVMDPIALQALLRVVGPIEVDGQVFDADNVLRYIFVDQYDEFLTGEEVSLDNLSTLADGQAARRDRLSALAGAAVAALSAGGWEPLELLASMRPIVAGRHLLAYGSRPVEQAMWAALGADGHLDGDEFGLALLNIGANKLDPFVSVEARVESSPAGDASTEFVVTVDVANNAKTTLPIGVTGYYWDVPLGLPTSASYLGRLMVVAPGWVTEMDVVSGAERLEVFGSDGQNAMMVARLAPIPEGETATVVARIVMAHDGPEPPPFAVMPSARYPAIAYSWDGLEFDDSVRRSINE